MNEAYLPDGSIYYRLNELRPGRTTLLFVHGLSGSSSAWVAFEEAFAANYNVVSLDLRGHGRSVRPRGYHDYSAAYFASDIARLVEHLELEPFVLVSHSMGTLIALQYLKEHQDKVRAAIFLSPSASPKTGFAAHLLKPLLAFGRTLRLYRPAKKRGDHIDYVKYPQKSDWDIPAVWHDIRNTSLGVYLFSTEQMLETDYKTMLEKIRIPTLIIHGREDSIFPLAQGEAVARGIPGAELKIIEEADHIIVKNKAQEVIGLISAFLRRLPQAGL